jgi:hypothetical protein
MDDSLSTPGPTSNTESTTRAMGLGPRLLFWLAPAVLFAIAFLARDVRLGSFSWPDEVTWTARSIAFYSGLAQGDLEATHQTDHPGVVPMWGYGGLLSLRALLHGDLADLYTMTTERKLQDIPGMLATEALWTVMVTSLTVVGVYLLLKRVLDARVSFLVALMVALDPFFLVQSRVVHVDAIFTSFMTLSALALAVYLVHPTRKRYLVLSAIVGGLAFGTKSPALVLVPLVTGGLALRLLLNRDGPDGRAGEHWRRRLAWAALALLAWLGIAWASFLVVWPAAWRDPLRLTSLVILGSRWGVVTSHGFNYFLGQVNPAPGPLFYLVVGPLRMTPLTLIFAPLGGVLFLLDLRRARRQGLSGRLTVLAMALALVIGYGAGISFSAKKGDRYLLPIYPMLEVLAALSLSALLNWLGRRWRILAGDRRQFAVALVSVLFVALFWLPLAPYYGAFFNPLLGGGQAAVWAFPFGQGEGLDLAAAYLNQKEDAERLRVASFYPEELQAYFRGDVISLRRGEWSKTWLYSDYVVFYVSQVQRKLPTAALVDFFSAQDPEYVARLGGVDFVRIYPSPVLLSGHQPNVEQRFDPLRLGEELGLVGYALTADRTEPGEATFATLYWQALKQLDRDYEIQVRLIDQEGQIAWQQVGPPFEGYFPTWWWRPGQTMYDRYRIDLSDDLPPGEYWLLVAAREPESDQMLTPHGPRNDAWPDALVVGAIRVESTP